MTLLVFSGTKNTEVKRMETKKFDLPTHPSGRKQAIIVERPEGSVWYLVVEKDKAIPLVNLKNPKTAKEVLDALGKQNGEGAVMQFVMGGYSHDS